MFYNISPQERRKEVSASKKASRGDRIFTLILGALAVAVLVVSAGAGIRVGEQLGVFHGIVVGMLVLLGGGIMCFGLTLGLATERPDPDSQEADV